MLLAGDIGGTKTVLAVFTTEGGARRALAEATFSSGRYDSLQDIVREFLADVRLPVTSGSFGVAGPVVGGHATITNLPWTMGENELAADLGLASVRLLNDLAAIANAIPFLEPDDLHTLNRGVPEPGGALAVIAPGTGLGEAFLTWDGVRYRPHPSEGGHADFAPKNETELALLSYLLPRLGHVSWERVCAGIGLPNIYAFFKDSGYATESEWVAAALAEASDPTPVIARAALDESRPCKLSRITLETFVSILGAEAGNLALKVLATGGVYLGGGIPPRILPVLDGERFLAAFGARGRFSDLVRGIPVHVILHPRTALLGAACHGLGAAAAPPG